MNSFFMNEVSDAIGIKLDMKEGYLEQINKEKQNRLRKEDPYAIELQEGIIKRIGFLCRTKKISINELAKASGLTPSTIKSILYGYSKNTGIVTLNSICSGFNITLEEFFRSRLFK